MTADARRFFFDTGSLALALVDTVGARGRPLSPGGGRREYLDSPSALAAWARQAGLGPGRLPAPAELRRVQLLREAIYRLLCAALDRRPPRPRDLAILNRAVAEAAPEPGIVWRRGAFVPARRRRPRLAQTILARVAAETRMLLLDPAALRACADLECGWLFLDRSQARRRRWCSMAECGNRAKARRFRGTHASVRE